MKVVTREGSRERSILIGMITKKKVLSHIATKWEKEGLFRSKWSNIIAGWAVKHYNRYGTVPKRNIENYFVDWAERSRDKKSVELVEQFLTGLSGQYERNGFDPQALLDSAVDHFNSVRLAKLRDDMSEQDWQDALTTMRSYEPIDMGTEREVVDIFTSSGPIADAFIEHEEHEVIVRYEGALGRFYRRAFERDGFIAFMGAEKTGKTWFLLDVAWTAFTQRRRVAFFEIGDLSRNQIVRRFGARASRIPIWYKPYNYPISIARNSDDEVVVAHTTKKPKAPITFDLAWKAICRVQDQELKSRRSFLRMVWRPANTLTVAEISKTLRRWRDEGWAADLCVIDYADLLAPPMGIQESWDAINQNWIELRRLSQEMKGLVVTATQANAAAYSAERLGKKHFSGNKLKFAHCTGMVGINQTPIEKKLGKCRLNWLALREDEFVETECVYCAPCLAIANPCIRSLL